MWGRKPNKISINPALNICVVKTDKDGNKSWLYGKNQVTNDGDVYYATRAGTAPSVTTAPDPDFFSAACVLQNPSSADTIAKADTYSNVSSPITTSGAVQNVETGFPKVNDTTTENTGKDVDAVTYKFTWTTSQIDTSSGNPITGGSIVDQADVTSGVPAAGSKLLTHWNFVSPSSFHKTNTDTLTLYVNHTMSGQA